MARLDVRCEVNLPVRILLRGEDNKITENEGRFTSLSLSGGYIKYTTRISGNRIIGLRYDLPRHGEFEIIGEIVRHERDGFATRFYNLNRDAKLKLWDYLKDNLPDDPSCPYCGKKYTKRVNRCEACGWTMNFYSQDYFVEHEKESFFHRLAMKCRSFSLEDMYKVLNFIDVEILKIGKNLEINEEFVGSSQGMLDVFAMIRRIAPSDIPVLITGESGTGKELTARAIHERSLRKKGPFVTISCTVIPEDLLEGELFGYVKGSFTGAVTDKIGKIQYADGGTVFLDEIGDMPLNLQTKILRFLEDRTVTRIGENQGKKVDVRLIAATSKDLRSAIAKGKFRKELYYRLNVFNIHLPPIRDRGEDKLILARYFLNKFSREMNLDKSFSEDAIEAIRNYDWPGNVREIINRVRRAVVLSSLREITATDLDIPFYPAPQESTLSLKEAKSTIERQKLAEALKRYNYNISKVARVLGISRPSVYSLKKKYNL